MSCNCNKKGALNWAITVIGAWGNYITNNTEGVELGKKRIGYCSNCSYAKPDKILSIIPDNEFPSIQGKKCSKCNCPLSAKIRSKDYCPDNKW